MLFKRSSSTVCTACSQAWVQPFSLQVLQASQKQQFTSHVRRTNHHHFPSSRSLTTTTIQRRYQAPVRKEKNVTQQRFTSTAAAATNDDLAAKSSKEALFAVIENIYQAEDDIVQSLQELDLVDAFPHLVYSEDLDLVDTVTAIVGHRNEAELTAKVVRVRQQFRDSLPENMLSEEEMQFYKTLYGEPLPMEEAATIVEDGPEPDQLFRNDGEGGWVEIEQPSANTAVEEETEHNLALATEYENNTETEVDYSEMSLEDRASSIAKMLGGEVVPFTDSEVVSEDDHADSSGPRTHPLTTEGKFTTGSKTLLLPYDSMTKPISRMLSAYSNKHLAETAHRLFGGANLPYSTSTPPKNIPPTPIQLDAGQRIMSEIESHAFLAVLYPGIYASVLPVLVEVRKRLGSKWLRDLMAQKDGPRVLDVGGGGAGILAWREVLKAEWSLMSPNRPPGSPIPFGRSTVVTGSHALRHRASQLLENTTFLPRLPDYVHVRDQLTTADERPPPQRKQFDVIIAPHTIWPIREDYHRKEHVENLWSLLNPDGGVLILLEKGIQRGFEAIAGAREMILERLIASPGSTEYENPTQSPDSERFFQKGKGMIIAPCTTHAKCPMYTNPGKSIARKDFCHFQQRYIRPPYLQRIKGAKDTNHEDAKFSYVAVQRGTDMRETHGIIQDQRATDAAFAGFENIPFDVGNVEGNAAGETITFHPLSLPRLILPPLKRQGHSTLDLCTPAGKIERWTVPRSFSKQAYRDARKSAWGDLWALGAKSRSPRNIKLGFVDDQSGGKKFERRVRKQSLADDMADEEYQLGTSGTSGEVMEEGEGEDRGMNELREAMGRLDPSGRRERSSRKPEKRKKVPAWVKKMEVRKERKARRINDFEGV
ncbi:37S ribosomal protein Rsm22 [Histoplasma capsulatum var. duboisii H88]|uniref:37S ribosomal protein Rsm22 n=2 Tax=Ajellomyces capsulatus TaxID=5037 RepID=F0U6Y9_AJEC8|nr:37S ribosomal protein Rsm22 [Histoplasma capsulatum H143]EGC42360.1 37S ribosomal protein Rsm22 [Histoplasma capsulatum var. duboisii H88]QSS51238.1 37S ribosomal protein Rsm22 [Histoplasma capsulatum var. duboisii H88]